jgi:hypothetical protein
MAALVHHGRHIIELARKLWDLRPAQSQKIGESQLGRMELLPPDKGGTNSATLVELKSKDGKTIRSVLLGKKSMRSGGGDPMGGGGWSNGRWIYLPDKPGTAYLVSEAFSEIEPKPDRWLAKDFFKDSEEFIFLYGDDLYSPKNVAEIVKQPGLAVMGMKVDITPCYLPIRTLRPCKTYMFTCAVRHLLNG